MRRSLFFLALAAGSAAVLRAQIAPLRTSPPPAAIERLNDHMLRMGFIRVDTASKEIMVPGTVNQVGTLEFIANTRGGMKAYESALTLDTDAVTFNAALLLIGLDKSHATVPTRHFDAVELVGDQVDIWVDLMDPPNRRRIRAEQLVFDKSSGQTMPEGHWVYTGSTFAGPGRYLADLDGVLIGFVHSPAPVIESPRGTGLGNYGSVVFNPNIGLAPGAHVILTVKAVTP